MTSTVPVDTARGRALAYVRDLVLNYRAALRRPNLPERVVVFYHERIRSLTGEATLLLVPGEDGDRLARTWCKVASL